MARHLIHNVSIHTMDNTLSRARAMVWEDDTILELGEKTTLEKHYRPTRIIDGKETTLLPGFIDPHIHFFDGALFRGGLDCSPGSIQDIHSLVSAVAGQADTQPLDAWVVGHGYDPQALAGKPSLTRYDLDHACADRPVAIFHYSMHECVVNSKALTILDIDTRTPQPHTGEIVKDRSGNPTGRLVEMPQGTVVSKVRDNLMIHWAGDIIKRLKAAQDLVFGYGITCIGDPAVSSSTQEFYEKAFAEGVLSLPIVIYPCDDDNFFALPSARAVRPIKQPIDKRLTIGPLKIFLDGAEQAAMRLSPVQVILSFLKAVRRSLKTGSLDPVKLMLRSSGHYKRGNLHFGISMVNNQIGRECVKKAIET